MRLVWHNLFLVQLVLPSRYHLFANCIQNFVQVWFHACLLHFIESAIVPVLIKPKNLTLHRSTSVLCCNILWQVTRVGLSFLLAGVFVLYLDTCLISIRTSFHLWRLFFFMILRVLCVSSPAFSRYLCSLPLGSSVIVFIVLLGLSSPHFETPGHWITSGFQIFWISLRPMAPLPSLTALEFSGFYFNQLVLLHWLELNSH